MFRSDPATRRRLGWAALVLLATLAYGIRIRHEMIDFLTWRLAAVRALHAEPLYRAEDGHYQFKYFPAFAVVMAPFGAVDQEVGKALWFALSVALLVALLRTSVGALPGRRSPRAMLLAVAFVLLAKFYVRELLLGQTNLLLGALLLAALVAAQRRRPLGSGALVGAAAFIKPYAFILSPWLLVAQGWRSAAVAGGVVAVGLCLPAVVYGWSGNLDLLREWLDTVSGSTAPNLLGNDNVSIAAMWAKWLGPGRLANGLSGLTLVGILAAVTVVWRRREAVDAPDYLEVALLMLLIPLVSPQGWDYVLLLGTPAVVCLVDRRRELGRAWRWAVGAAVVVMGLTFFDLMGRALYGRFMALSGITVCALVAAAGLVHMRRRGLA